MFLPWVLGQFIQQFLFLSYSSLVNLKVITAAPVISLCVADASVVTAWRLQTSLRSDVGSLRSCSPFISPFFMTQQFQHCAVVFLISYNELQWPDAPEIIRFEPLMKYDPCLCEPSLAAHPLACAELGSLREPQKTQKRWEQSVASVGQTWGGVVVVGGGGLQTAGESFKDASYSSAVCLIIKKQRAPNP